MSKADAKIVAQIEALLEHGTAVQIERTGLPCEYEVTLYPVHRGHTHHGGKTLAEAVNRAAAPHKGEGNG